MGVVHLISVRHAPLGETSAKMLVTSLLFGVLVNTISSVPAPGHFFHPGYHGYHHACTTELEAVTKTLCRIELEKPVHHGYFYHKREAEVDAHGFAYEKVTKTICKKTPITEEVSKDFELCRPKPSEVCEDKEVKVPKLVCEGPAEEETKDI